MFLQDLQKAFFENELYIRYLEGVWVTLKISFFAVLIGVLIGVLIASVKHFAKDAREGNLLTRIIFFVLEGICNIYVGIIRGTPVMLQITIAMSVIFTTEAIPTDIAAAIVFGINSGAYVSEIIRGGINSIDKGQTEAGRSLGLSPLHTMRLIILPQAIKNILPSLGNEFIMLVKETAIVGAFAVEDLTKVATQVGLRNYKPLPSLIVAGIFYLIVVLGLTQVMSIFERRLAKSDNR